MVGVGGQSVPPGVETEGRAPGYGEVECYVGGGLELQNKSHRESKLGGTGGNYELG